MISHKCWTWESETDSDCRQDMMMLIAKKQFTFIENTKRLRSVPHKTNGRSRTTALLVRLGLRSLHTVHPSV